MPRDMVMYFLYRTPEGLLSKRKAVSYNFIFVKVTS